MAPAQWQRRGGSENKPKQVELAVFTDIIEGYERQRCLMPRPCELLKEE